MDATVTPNHDTGKAPTGYRELMRTRSAWSFVLPGFAARQPFAMLTIGIVLLVRHTTGSYGAAGAAAAVTGISMALFAPRWGRLADRFGQRAVLLPGVPAHTAAVTCLVLLALAHAPVWAVLAAAVPTGGSVPQIGPMVRARWAVALEGSPLLGTAAAFESVTDEFTFVIGPVLATALCTGVHPAAGLIAEAALTLVGGLLFAARRDTQPTPGPRRPRPGASSRKADGYPGEAGGSPGEAGGRLPAPAVRVLAAAFCGVGVVFGGMQVSLTSYSQSIGHPGANGVLYGIFATGNMLSGVVCGAASGGRFGPRRRLLVAYTLLVLGCATLWTSGSLPAVGGLGLLVGACVAPALVCGYVLVGALVPAGARTEAFTWLTSAVAFGQAMAATAAGWLADSHGPAAAFLVPPAGTLPALVVLVALRGRLVPRPGGRVAARAINDRERLAVD